MASSVNRPSVLPGVGAGGLPNIQILAVALMALLKLEDALIDARLCSVIICIFALMMYIGNGSVVLENVNRCSLPSLAIQALVTTVELVAPFCFGVANGLPNNLLWSYVIIVVDCLAACFAIITGIGGINVFIFLTYKQHCLKQCKISFVYALFVWVGGAFGGIAAMCNLILAAKMNIQRQAQD